VVAQNALNGSDDVELVITFPNSLCSAFSNLDLLYIFSHAVEASLASCCSRKIEYYLQHRNTSSLRISSAKRPVELFPTAFLPNLVKV
jgi:hypothetical protein